MYKILHIPTGQYILFITEIGQLCGIAESWEAAARVLLYKTMPYHIVKRLKSCYIDKLTLMRLVATQYEYEIIEIKKKRKKKRI